MSAEALPPVMPIPEQVPEVTPESGTRLEQLHAAYADAKAARDEAESKLKAITDAVKLELNTAYPDATSVDLAGSNGPRLRLSYTESWRLDSTRLKREQPATYAAFAKQSGSWGLREVKDRG